jgi:hypothetical protein
MLTYVLPVFEAADNRLLLKNFFLYFYVSIVTLQKKVTLHYNLLNFSFMFSLLGFKRRNKHTGKNIGFFLLALFENIYVEHLHSKWCKKRIEGLNYLFPKNRYGYDNAQVMLI